MKNVDGWSTSGFLATGGAVLPGTLPEVHLQANFSEEQGGPGAQYFTVQFSANPPPSGVFYAVAEVTWSVEGNAITRKINVVNGAVISGTGQFVKVSVKDQTTTALLTSLGLTAQKYYVDVTVTPGSRPSTQQPPRLLPPPGGSGAVQPPGSYFLAPLGTAVIPIDQTAGPISVNVGGVKLTTPPALASGDITVELLIDGAFGAALLDLKDIIGDWVPLPPGVNEILITNNSAANNAIVNVFLGIEG